MPLCNCVSFLCGTVSGGTQRDQRTIDKHGIADFRLRANEARVQELNKTDNAVSSFVASMSLADKTSGPTVRSGGKLWSPAPAKDSDIDIMDAHLTADAHPEGSSSEGPSAGRKQRPGRAGLFDQLKKIEQNLDHLISTTNLVSQAHCFPSSITQPYPLEANLQSARDLRSDLLSIKSGFLEVLAVKETITDRLEPFLRSLQEGRKSWISAARKYTPPSAPDDPIPYDTGKSFTYYIYHPRILMFHGILTEHHHRPVLKGVNPVIQAMVFTIAAIQIVSKVSRSACRFVLEMMGYVVKLVIMASQPEISPQTAKLLQDLPIDPDSAADQFGLDGKSTIYAVCPDPQCHRTYKPEFRDGCPIAEYPKYCENKRFRNGHVCGTILTRPRIVKDVEIEVPIKPFVYFDYKDWLAGLLSRPGYEDRMDSAWKSRSSGDEMHDIFDGDYLRDFKGPDGKTLFGDAKDEGRYAFTLCVDFFNPYTNKQGGKKASVGIISLVCLNLPPEERYKPENMFLAGIVPGPQEPPLNTLNHYLTPIVDDFLDLWEPGVRFSHTCNFPSGRVVRCALIALVCDLPGARKTAGFAHFKHRRFCSACHCTRDNEGYGTTKYESWKMRTNLECREWAKKFLDAEDEASRQEVFDECGIRNSELARLPYFDLVRCVVVDAMHNLFLGLIKEHFRNIIGIGRSKKVENAAIVIEFSTPPADFTENERKTLKSLTTLLQKALYDEIQEDPEKVLKKFMRMHNRTLAFACSELGVDEDTIFINADGKASQSIKTCAEKLLFWVSASRL